MASRYPTTQVVDYCYNPVHVVDGDKDIIVPCGKCDGCLLHSANEWSMRLGMELESSPFNIFYTLTYNNKYLPKLRKVDDSLGYSWFSNHPDNIRFNGVKDVLREDNIYFEYPYLPLKIQNFSDYPAINYASKRDIQLWLKMIRKTINLDLKIDGKDRLFRYYIISEVGPTTLRCHFHGLFFTDSKEISDYLLSEGMYKNWQMCDKNRFDQYAHYCDSGARGYVTQYLTCSSKLPRVYREIKEIRPFRLASKSPAIGYRQQKQTEICKGLERGTLEYTRSIQRLGQSFVLRRPKNFTVSLFPKCYQYALVSDSRKRFIYGCIYEASRKYGRFANRLLGYFRDYLKPSDYQAATACDKLCSALGCTPFHYLYLLDMHYYLRAMCALKVFYEFQEKFITLDKKFDVLGYYVNIEEVFCKSRNNIGRFRLVLYYLLEGFAIPSDSLDSSVIRSYTSRINYQFSTYKCEVDDIINGMVKTAKFRELNGSSPCSL